MVGNRNDGQPSGPYPGFDETGNYYTPRRAPRVRPEAEEYANKNRGSLELFGSGTPRPVVQTPRAESRCPTQEGKSNYEAGRNGTVSTLIYGGATPRPDSARVPRVRPEAEEIADHHKGKNTDVLFKSFGKLPLSARKEPRVKREAADTAEKHAGGYMKNLMHDPKQIPLSSRKEPRIKPEAQSIANKEGRELMKGMTNYGAPTSSRAVPRVKPEAEETAEQGRGGRMDNILHKYGTTPTSPQAVPRVKPEAEDTANLDKGGRMSRLMHEGSKMRRSPRPPPRANSKAAKSIIRKSHGTMQSIISQQGSLMIVPAAGR